MARPLRVKRLDSPLARNGVVAMQPVGEGGEPAAGDIDNAPIRYDATLTSPEKADREADSPPAVTGRLPPPPPLEEPLEFVSGRVPASLAQRLNAMTLALRQCQPTRASQKGLPQQEVLASCGRSAIRTTQRPSTNSRTSTPATGPAGTPPPRGSSAARRRRGALHRPLPRPHGCHPLGRGDVAQVAVGRGKRALAELLLDDVGRHALGRELGGVGVAQAVGVDALLDAGLAGEAGEQPAEVGGIEWLASKRAEDRAPREPERSAAVS